MAAVESGHPEAQQEPSEAHQIVVDNNGAENIPKDEPRVPSSEQPRHDVVESRWANLSICRIPHHLKDGDKKAYVPQIVSLGPYHHGEEHLRPMEEHKLRCLHQILARSHHEIGLYLDSVKEVEQRARACYEGTISMSSDEFVQMMVLDGCFVIELLRGYEQGFEKLGYPCNDPIFSTWGSMLKTRIMRDMILLENQIPFFILDRLLGLQLGLADLELRVHGMVLNFFHSEIGGRLELDPSPNQLHCLKVLWWSLLPRDLEQKKTQEWAHNREQLIPCLTVLRESGIKLRRGYGSVLGDIRFMYKDGILEIPKLMIHDGTRSLFLNLIAFEQSQFDCGNHITSYVIFMHRLMNSPEDVRYLYKHEIIEHCLGSDAEVADLFNRLCRELAFNICDSYLDALSSDLADYYFGSIPNFPNSCVAVIKVIYLVCVRSLGARSLARKWRGWRAILKNKYFDNPWSIISIIAAFVLLVLTSAQTFYAVYGYYWPRS
ncbi:UPF0481 protein At3g47200-like [Rhodamnia argentea]|uniref:UPF0481 protein At3g47200-like n=1 Tax=Rhodamnia argentea TaxID=178133 RepID=A0A8B8PBV0_9MYRT|nr:UPF0481 protein At3g47200-like [Rhodamnia argentea]